MCFFVVFFFLSHRCRTQGASILAAMVKRKNDAELQSGKYLILHLLHHLQNQIIVIMSLIYIQINVVILMIVRQMDYMIQTKIDSESDEGGGEPLFNFVGSNAPLTPGCDLPPDLQQKEGGDKDDSKAGGDKILFFCLFFGFFLLFFLFFLFFSFFVMWMQKKMLVLWQFLFFLVVDVMMITIQLLIVI